MLCRMMGIKRSISIHAPREGGDVVNVKRFPSAAISIHAPREGGDLTRR